MKDLLESARSAQANAHAPYSGFRVGASIRTSSGTLYNGCNVENSAYPEGICAEGAAIAAMVSAGEREITEVLVIGSGHAVCSPCGGCRQKLGEFSSKDTPVHMCNEAGERTTLSMGELLPHAFNADSMEDTT